jgi:hypothetical protein
MVQKVKKVMLWSTNKEYFSRGKGERASVLRVIEEYLVLW